MRARLQWSQGFRGGCFGHLAKGAAKMRNHVDYDLLHSYFLDHNVNKYQVFGDSFRILTLLLSRYQVSTHRLCMKVR